jgi:hypothetical protein
MKPSKQHSPFDWKGQPSTLIDKMGRLKSQRQMLLDAVRVNPEQHSCTPNQTKSKVAPR